MRACGDCPGRGTGGEQRHGDRCEVRLEPDIYRTYDRSPWDVAAGAGDVYGGGRQRGERPCGWECGRV